MIKLNNITNVIKSNLVKFKSPYASQLALPQEAQVCFLCASPKNIIGVETYIHSNKVVTFWFYCEDHREAFERERQIIESTNLENFMMVEFK